MSGDLQLKQFIDRILRLKEEQDTISHDIKEVYAEMKAQGFDKTAAGSLVSELRKKGKDGTKFEEANAILELYRDAYERASSHTHAPARMREASGSSSGRTADFGSANGGSNPSPETADPETGEIIETQESAVSSDRNEPGRDASLNAPTGSASDEMPETVSPAHFLRAGDDGRPQTSTEAYQVKDAGQGGIIVGVHSEQEKAGGPQGGNEAASGLPAPVANSAPVIGHVRFATSSHINRDEMPEIPAFLRRDFERAEA